MTQEKEIKLQGTPVTVIGGGIAGIMFAIEAAEHGAKVALFEKNAKVLTDTSSITPGRMTLGFHFTHAPTAISCLETVIHLTRKFPGFRRGEERSKPLPVDHPIRRGRYFIMKDYEFSLTPSSDLSIEKNKFYLKSIDAFTLQYVVLDLNNEVRHGTITTAMLPALEGILSDKFTDLKRLESLKSQILKITSQAGHTIKNTTNVSTADIIATYKSIQEEYERLCEEDKDNKIFGDQLYRILEKEDYANQVDVNQIEMGIETCEHLLNFENFRDFLIKAIGHLDITIHTNHELTNIKEGSDGAFKLIFKNGVDKNGEDILIIQQTKYVVNATWSQIARINQAAGFPMAKSNNAKELFVPRTNRLKVLAHVKLPEDLKQTHHIFFCMGPRGGMLANLNNGTGLLADEEITNMAISTGLELNEIALIENESVATIEELRAGKKPEEKITKVGEKEYKYRDIAIVEEGLKVTIADIISAPIKLRYNQKTGNEEPVIKLVYYVETPDQPFQDRLCAVKELSLNSEVKVQQGITIREILLGALSRTKKNELGQKLIDGIAERIYGMDKAKLIGVRFGIVRTEGEYNPDDINSAYHKRGYPGATEEQTGWINLEGTKLMFAHRDAKLAFDILCQQESVDIGINNAAHALQLTKEKRDAFISVARNRTTGSLDHIPAQKEQQNSVMKNNNEFILHEDNNKPIPHSEEKRRFVISKLSAAARPDKSQAALFQRQLVQTGAGHEAVAAKIPKTFSLFKRSETLRRGSPGIEGEEENKTIISPSRRIK